MHTTTDSSRTANRDGLGCFRMSTGGMRNEKRFESPNLDTGLPGFVPESRVVPKSSLETLCQRGLRVDRGWKDILSESCRDWRQTILNATPGIIFRKSNEALPIVIRVVVIFFHLVIRVERSLMVMKRPPEAGDV